MNEKDWERAYWQEKRINNIILQKYRTANKWVELFCKDRKLQSGLDQSGIERIMIYGASEFALRLLEVCEKENITVTAISDKRITADGNYFKNIPLIPVKQIKDYLQERTGVIVTSMGYWEEIRKELEEMKISNVMSLKELLLAIEN